LQSILGLVTPLHVGLGAAAIAAGAAALAAAKGRPLHVSAGRVFAVTMGGSAALGALLGLTNAESFYITFPAGVLALTLILSGWLSARIRNGRLSPVMMAIGMVNAANAAGLIVAGSQAQASPDGLLFGFAAEDYYFLAGMAGVAAAGDLSLLFRKTLSPRHRIARHLWRMGLGFFIAAGSAFTGPGASAFPDVVRQSGVLAVPELVIAALIVFWLAHTLLKRGPQTTRSAS